MPIDLEDYAPRLQARAAEQKEEKIFQLQSQHRVGLQMRELMLDERWASYVKHIESLVNAANHNFELGKTLLDGPKFLTPEQYGQQKLDIERHRAKKDAYCFVLNLAQMLVNQGEKAAEELVAEKLSA